MTASEFVARLGPKAKPTKTAGGWLCRCPAHDDAHASLSVTQEAEKVLIHCHAGCPPERICAAGGLKLSDLFVAQPERNGHGKKIVATYDYKDEFDELLL